jgi:hypothetical protein
MADRHGELLPCVLWITEEQATGQACIPQIRGGDSAEGLDVTVVCPLLAVAGDVGSF